MKTVEIKIKDLGIISFELWEENAPNTIHRLLEVIALKKYDNKVIERFEPNFVLQPLFHDGLDKDIDVMVTPEFNPTILFDRGIVGMAGTTDKTSGSQFFITLSRSSRLDNHFTVIGKVTSGYDILLLLEKKDVVERMDPSSHFIYHTFKEDVIIESVRVVG